MSLDHVVLKISHNTLSSSRLTLTPIKKSVKTQKKDAIESKDVA